MKGKSRGSQEEKEYSEEMIQKKLHEWYGEQNCICLDNYVYIVQENGKFYLMKQSIPEIFFTSDAILLTGIISIEVEPMEDGYVTLKINGNDTNIVDMMSKTRAIEKLLHWAG
ncbi:MAG: hypothetical protein J6A04_04325 [Clostridia bacterium]|nr:hypothetical protein [Clostridia bacterium]